MPRPRKWSRARWCFHLHPDRARPGLEVEVLVYASVDRLRLDAKERWGFAYTQTLVGATLGILQHPTHFATILLAVGHLGVGTVPHEAVHAGFRWARHIGWRDLRTAYSDRASTCRGPRARPYHREEQLAEVIGEITRQTYNGLYRGPLRGQ